MNRIRWSRALRDKRPLKAASATGTLLSNFHHHFITTAAWQARGTMSPWERETCASILALPQTDFIASYFSFRLP